LREAQQLGYAERDPSSDVDGIDTACKLVILANSVMGISATFKDVKIEGIRGISEEGVKLAKEDGKVIKLVGEIVKEGKRLEVSPRLVPRGHFLDISGTFNIGLFRTDRAGDVAIVGRGAGKMETASAIFGDLKKILALGGRKLLI
jgi:homoserine dehydrogenase